MVRRKDPQCTETQPRPQDLLLDFLTTIRHFENRRGEGPGVELIGTMVKLLARVVQRLDNTIHRINHYPADSVVCFVNIYPLDSDLSGG